MVNVNDVKTPDKIPANPIKAIFDKQRELALKYQEIEKMPKDLISAPENNIDTPEGQKWIKDFAWRTTEEICEALEAKDIGMKKAATEQEKTPITEPMPDINNLFKIQEEYQHYLEELIDALHFLTELTIIAGYTWEDFNTLYSKNSREMNVVYFLGLAMNCLKNKPWKQSHMLTDRPKFKKYVQKAYIGLLGVLAYHDLNRDDIYILYFKKNAVNQFRQRSKY